MRPETLSQLFSGPDLVPNMRACIINFCISCVKLLIGLTLSGWALCVMSPPVFPKSFENLVVQLFSLRQVRPIHLRHYDGRKFCASRFHFLSSYSSRCLDLSPPAIE